MLTYVKGDATQPQGDGRKIIVHCCNDRGAWGSGFVVALSRRWPEPEAKYRSCPQYHLGDIIWARVEDDIWVANLIGQHRTGFDEFGYPPIRYDAILQGLRRIGEICDPINASVHMPRMGAGLAGGNWSIIELIVEQELVAKGVPVTVYDL
jgi:O-acetyl-ADP-ribose deacetylase (regulator of RNase III)